MGTPGDDLISELLRPLRLTGVFVSHWQVNAPWAVDGDPEDCAVFHYVLHGTACIWTKNAEPIHLKAGDLALIPTGHAHFLGDTPESRTVPLHTVLPGREPGVSRRVRFGGGGGETRLLCAGLHFDATAATSLYLGLPWALVFDQQQVRESVPLHSTLAWLADPRRDSSAHHELVTLRAFEFALLLALQPRLQQLERDTDVIPAMRHNGIRKALTILSTRFSEPWTVESIAREVGMSRSAFTTDFHNLVGETPARYLTGRRMQEAVRLLSETSVRQSEIPERLGYHSSVGFHLAFRKWFDTTPGEYRRRRGSAAAPRKTGTG